MFFNCEKQVEMCENLNYFINSFAFAINFIIKAVSVWESTSRQLKYLNIYIHIWQGHVYGGVLNYTAVRTFSHTCLQMCMVLFLRS